jgi:uncharacterized membrane protein YcaP (DUF421 family)
MSLGAIAIRALFAYLFLLLILRMSGKRTVGQATPLDFVAALILGDLIDDLLWAEVSAARFVVAAGGLMVLHIAVSMGAYASPAFCRVVLGVPTKMVSRGTLERVGMRRERVNEQELNALLRQSSVDDRREVKSGALENSGHLSVIQEEWAREAQKEDLDRVKKVTK